MCKVADIFVWGHVSNVKIMCGSVPGHLFG